MIILVSRLPLLFVRMCGDIDATPIRSLPLGAWRLQTWGCARTGRGVGHTALEREVKFPGALG